MSRLIIKTVLLCVLCLCSNLLPGQSDGTLDTAFDPGTGFNNQIWAMAVQSDGKVLYGGQFTTALGASIPYLARLNSDGTIDSAFSPGLNNTVFAILIQPDGKILIGGNFTMVGTTAVGRIARLDANGSLDTTFDPGTGANNVVYAIARQADGNLVIGGNFTEFAGVTRDRMARIDATGTLETGFTASASAQVRALAIQSDGKILVGGGFGEMNTVTVNRICRLETSGALDTTFNAGDGAAGIVRSIAIQADGKAVIGGQFIAIDNATVNRIARLNTNGSLDTTFDCSSGTEVGANGVVVCVLVQFDQKILLGGTFTTLAGTARQRIARLNSDGSVDTAFASASGANDAVNAMALRADDNILIGGAFTTYATVARARAACIHNTVPTSVPPSITSTASTSVLAGNLYTYTITGTGLPTPQFDVTGLPSWLSFDNVNTISGTPASGDAGATGTIVVTAFNGVNPDDIQQFAINVNLAPSITTSAPTTVIANQSYSYVVAADGFPLPSFSANDTSATWPAWLTFTPATRTLSGTPAASDIGTTGQIVLTASNGIGSPATESFSILVSGVAPAFTSTEITTATAGTLYSYTVTADGLPAPSLNATTLPVWLNFNPATGLLSGTPGAADIGTTGNQVVIEASNSQGTDTHSFTINVSGVTPQITSTPSNVATISVPYSYTVVATGIPTPTLSANMATLPTWLNFNPATGELSGTPTSLGLSTTVEITASGWGTDATQSFQIQVNGTAPQITSTPPATVTFGQTYLYTVVTTGDPAPSVSVSVSTPLPGWLVFTGSLLSGSPSASDIGATIDVTLIAENGESPDDTQSFQINVLGVAPTITSTPLNTTNVGASYTYTLTATGTPAPSFSAAGLPGWLSLNTVTGELSGTPATADEGLTASITITASNGWGTDATQSFAINVGPAIGGTGNRGSSGGCSTQTGMTWWHLFALAVIPAIVAVRRKLA